VPVVAWRWLMFPLPFLFVDGRPFPLLLSWRFCIDPSSFSPGHRLNHTPAVSVSNSCNQPNSDPSTLRFGLKRGKLLYLFRYPTHDVEREKHRNVIARARYIKNNLEQEGYRLVPWDFKKGRPPTFWNDESTSMEGTNIEDDEDDLYGPSETTTTQQNVAQASNSDDEEKGDEPMDEGLESGEEEEEDDSVRPPSFLRCTPQLIHS